MFKKRANFRRFSKATQALSVTDSGERQIVPYWGNYAAMGIAAAARTDPALAEMGWKWLSWYSDHQDAETGFVTDYLVTVDDQEVSTDTHDSTDAYAGTFLMAVDGVRVATACVRCTEKLRPGVASQ